MRQFCYKEIEGARCLRLEGHEGSCCIRQDAEEPPLETHILILELADAGEYVWSRIWTFSTGGWMTWMADRGLITEIVQDGCDYTYGGMSWSDLSPLTEITEKGKAMLAEHVKVEW